jgi:hypothetical protein
MDPLEVGRCQIRIFGWHTDNVKMLPDEDLPWAMPIYQGNTSDTFSSPRVGDWAFGFFMDGESAQMPVYLGVFPYIVPKQVVDDDGFNPQEEKGAPTLPDGVEDSQVGQSSIAPLARGETANTGISKSNKDRMHICDITAKVDFDNAKEKLKNLVNVSTVRAESESLFAADSAAPIVQNVKDIKTAVAAQVKLVKEYTDTIKQEANALSAYVKYLQDTIKMIESLPEEAKALYAGCLKDLKASLSSVGKG